MAGLLEKPAPRREMHVNGETAVKRRDLLAPEDTCPQPPRRAGRLLTFLADDGDNALSRVKEIRCIGIHGAALQSCWIKGSINF
jgi:hypothetical protein